MATENPVALRGDAQSQENAAPIVPLVDIIEDTSGITLIADMPGVSKDRLDIKVQADRLFIEGEARVDVPAELKVFHTEVDRPRYRRTFTLSPELDSAAIDANLKDGVLTLRIPRSQAAQPRRIEVQVG